MKRIVALSLYAAVSTAAIADPNREGVYLCLTSSAIGFKHNEVERKWDPMQFTVDDHKYLIHIFENNKAETDRTHQKYRAEIKKFGEEKNIFSNCRQMNRLPKSTIVNERFIECSQLFTEWKINLEESDFLASSNIGFLVNNEIKNENDIYMIIGRCSKI